jgi:hypothetical protein
MHNPLLPFQGIFPHASELIGVCQPLLSWKSRQTYYKNRREGMNKINKSRNTNSTRKISSNRPPLVGNLFENQLKSFLSIRKLNIL